MSCFCLFVCLFLAFVYFRSLSGGIFKCQYSPFIQLESATFDSLEV